MSGAPSPAPATCLADRLALAVTYVVSPLALPLVALVAAARALGADGRETALVGALALVLTGLLPLALLVAMVRRGEARTLEVRERTRRTKPYLLGALGNALLGAALLTLLPAARHTLGALALWQSATVLLMLAVNSRWKISAHLVAVAGAFAALAWLRAVGGVPIPTALVAGLGLAVPVVAWARLRLGAHTRGQVLAGTLMGLALPPLQLLLWPGLG